MSDQVIVVGSGPSGLTAGFELEQAGHRVRLLEAADQVGGKMRSTRNSGFLLDQGAVLFPTTHRKLLDVCRRAGFADRLGPGGFVLATARDGRIHELDGDHLIRDFLRTPLLSLRAKVAAVKLAPSAVRARRATFDRIPESGPWDSETVDEWARRKVHPEVAEFLLSTMMTSMFNASSHNLSIVDFYAIVSLLGGAKLLAFPEGMGEWAETVAGRFDVECGATVRAVEETPTAVRVTWSGPDGVEHTESAAGCVLATPARTAIELHLGIDGWRREYMGRVRNGHSFTVNVALSKPPPRMRSVYVQVPKSVHPFLVGVAFDHNKAPGRVPAGKGMLTLATLSEWCDEHTEDTDVTIEKELIGALDDVLPGISADADFCVVNRWRQEFNPVGHYRDLGRFRSLCDTDGRIQLAGDYHSSQSLNSAAIAGSRAASRLIARVGRSEDGNT